MDFNTVLDLRRMVRNYTDEPISDQVVERIVEAGRRAPSAGNTQGQSFIVITDQDRRAKVAELAGEAGYVAQGFDPWVSRAPAHIVLCVSKQAYLDRYSEADKQGAFEDEWPVPYWWVDAGASMQNILLAAVNEGLAAGFLGVHALDGLKEELRIPEDVLVTGVVTLGHQADDRRSGSLKRPRVGQAIHWNQWNEQA